MEETKGKKLTSAAAVIMPAMVLSRITGFLRNVLITSQMSPKGYSDEFLVANRLPELMFELLVGGAIAAALIPVLSAYISKGKQKDGWKAVSTFVNLSILAILVLGTLGIIFTPQLTRIVASGFKDNMDNFNLTVRLTRYLIPSAMFMMLAGQCNAVLNSYNKFAAAAYGPVIYNISFVTGIWLFGAKSAELTAISVSISAAIYFVFQFSFSIKYFVNYRAKLYIRFDPFLRLFRLAVPALLSSTIVQINIIISTSFTTLLEDGRVTALTNASRTWMLPLGIFAQSIGTAMLPTLSSSHASMDRAAYKHLLVKSIKTVLLLAIPSAIGMLLLNQEIMRTLFKWSEVGEEMVKWSGAALMVYSIAIIYSSLILLMNRAFYSIQDSRIPLYINLTTVVVNLSLCFLFIHYTRLDIAGIALAYSISVIINSFLLIYLFESKTGIRIASELPVFLIKTLLSVILMACAILLLNIFISPDINSKISQVLSLGFKIAAGALVFYVSSILLRIDEALYMTGMLVSRLKRQFNL